MKCVSPVTIRNPNFGNISKIGYDSMYIGVPCGKCLPCLQNKRNDWYLRLLSEYRSSTNSCFVTLTYSDENCDGSVHKKDIQEFFARLRKRLQYHLGTVGLRFFCVSEYGPKTHRPHYHTLIFGYPDCDINHYIEKSWYLGFVCVTNININRIRYCAKYCISKNDVPENMDNNFMLCSRRPAIGDSFLTNKVKSFYSKRHGKIIYNDHGVNYSLPRRWKEKLLSEKQKNEIKHNSMIYNNDCYKKYQEKYAAYDEAALAHGNPIMSQLQIDQKLESMKKYLDKDTKFKL
ncbi:replication initiator protein [Capybara microvirus Cap3_SP_668]|nr:replication initiator protein [Capybara microvirus Cap3_SP_668]